MFIEHYGNWEDSVQVMPSILFESYKAISTRIVPQSLINAAQKKREIIRKGRRMKQR